MNTKLLLSLALVLIGRLLSALADETNNLQPQIGFNMSMVVNGMTNKNRVLLDATNSSKELANSVATNYEKFVLSSTNRMPTNFALTLPNIAAMVKTNMGGYTNFQTLELPAALFFKELIILGRLPGVSAGSHGQVTTGELPSTELNYGYPFARTFHLVLNGDSLTNHYRVLRASADADWQLQRAWRTDIEGHTIVEWPVRKYAAIYYYTNGIAEFEKNNKESALVNFTKAIEAKPDFAEAYFNRGYVKDGKGDLEGAQTDYTKAIELDSNYTHAYVNRGIIKRGKHDWDGAIADYTKAGEDAYAYSERGLAKQGKGDLDGALADFTKSIKLQPDLAAAYYNRGNLEAVTKNWDDALADFTKAIQFRPDFFRAYNNRGIVKQEKGDLDGAKADYKKAIEINPDYSDAQGNLDALNMK